MSITAASDAGLESKLRDALGDVLAAADDRHGVDDVIPAFVAAPTSVDQLAETLAKANELGAAVIPRGAGSLMALGNPPARYDVALSTAKLDRMLEYEPADLTIAVEAGMTLGRLQELLHKQGQFLPIDGLQEATIGGLLAVGLGGPSQHAYGWPRDWLLGCRTVLADGTVVRAGGRVVKNVAGYDLTRMAVGSLGTLGVIAEVTLKVAPAPAAQETLLAAHADTAAAFEVARTVAGRGLALRAIAVLENQAVYWLAGSSAAVERTRNEVRELTADVQTSLLTGDEADRWWSALDRLDATSDVTLRASVPPSALTGAMGMLSSLAEEVSIKRVAFPATGVVLARLTEGSTEGYAQIVERARGDILERGGSLLVTGAPAVVKERIDAWGDSPGLALMRRLKEEFDPKATLNPGRFVGGI